jgi:hypothetical protein
MTDLSAYFQCHKNPYATYESLKRFRAFYPTEPIILLSDNGYDYTEMAKHFNCTYLHETTSCRLTLPIRDGYQSTVERLRKVFSIISTEYFMLLEDDVHVFARYSEQFKGDINGNCINTLRSSVLNNIPFSAVKNEDKYFTGHGGSVYKTATMVRLLDNKDQINWLLDHWEKVGLGPMVDVDIFLSLIVVVNGGRIHHLSEHKDLLTNRVTDMVGLAALHQVKYFYGKELPENLKRLVLF